MNREILFRGKSNSTGKWHYGFLTYTPHGRHPQIIVLTSSKSIHIDVIPATVNQYTGLTDKNGRKIFEGDIIKCSDTINDIEFNAVVEFGNPNHDYSWGYQLKHISGEKPNLDILCWVDMEETGAFIEVIGNIHDNPELVRKDEENESSYKSD